MDGSLVNVVHACLNLLIVYPEIHSLGRRVESLRLQSDIPGIQKQSNKPNRVSQFVVAVFVGRVSYG